MKLLNRKNTIATLLLSSVILVSNNVSANTIDTSFENAITALVVEQGKQVMEEMNAQLNKSIISNVKQFSIDKALTWFANDTQATVTIIHTNNDNNTSADE